MERYLKLESNGHLSLQRERELLSKQCYDSKMQNELCLENKN